MPFRLHQLSSEPLVPSLHYTAKESSGCSRSGHELAFRSSKTASLVDSSTTETAATQFAVSEHQLT